MENDLEIKSLNKSFQSGFALKDINLTLPRGSVMGLIGQNGAGKTTAFRFPYPSFHLRSKNL